MSLYILLIIDPE